MATMVDHQASCPQPDLAYLKGKEGEAEMDDGKLAKAIEGANLPGAIALLGSSEGIHYSRAFGQRNVAHGTAMEPDSIVQIASMTKAIVSVAAVQLVEQGKLSLHGSLHDLLPELNALQVLTGFEDDGRPRLRPSARPITLHHLLTHTSGMGYGFVNADLMMTIDPEAPPPPNSMASISLPLLFDPGDNWEYGVGIDWVGLAVERASRQRLDAYLADHICGPLGMTDTVFFLSAEQEKRCAIVHVRNDAEGLDTHPIRLSTPNAEILSGGGGLWSTATDYFRFLQVLLKGGAPLLSPASMKLITTNQIVGLRAGRMATAMAELALPFEPFPDQHCGWSLAFLINPETGPHGRAGGSLSWSGIANTHCWLDPASDRIGVFLTQLLPFGDPGALAAFNALEHMAYGRG
jgi:methyl acetate hydrolase